MTNPIDSATPAANYKQPKRGRPALKDLVLIVRPPQDPAGVRAYTEDQLVEAEHYARQVSAEVQRLL